MLWRLRFRRWWKELDQERRTAKKKEKGGRRVRSQNQRQRCQGVKTNKNLSSPTSSARVTRTRTPTPTRTRCWSQRATGLSSSRRESRKPSKKGRGGEVRMQSVLVTAAFIDVGLQVVGWALSCALKTEKYYDMFGSFSFIAIAIASILRIGPAALSAKQIVLAALVLLWALRLGTFLVVRVFKTGGDKRFDGVKTAPGKFAVYWFLQAVWVYVTLLPTLLVMNQTISGNAFTWLETLGLSVFLLGFGLETCADTQKFKFKMNAENEGKFITEGVWKWSRHPNYFGEMVLWWGVYLVCLPNLNLAQSLVGLLSPVTVSLLISLLSGIPPLERSAEKRWGALETYQEYKKNTPVLIPFVHTRFLEYQREESNSNSTETLEQPLNQ